MLESITVKDNTFIIQLLDLRKTVSLVPNKCMNGTTLCLENVTINDLEICTNDENKAIESCNGDLLFKLKTNSEFLSKLRFVYYCGFCLAWEETEDILGYTIDEVIEENNDFKLKITLLYNSIIV